MLHNSELRMRAAIGFPGSLKRASATLLLLIILPVAANAYTVVLLNGRTLEINSVLQFTRSGITYEYAPGIFVTIQRTSIDVAATERANNEAAGTLLQRFENPQAFVSTTIPATQTERSARRTLTNEDLKPLRARREASEADYEKRRVELGLPSLEEVRRQREAEDARMSEMASVAEARTAEAESYWRERARELRTAIATTDAEINYLRRRLDEANDYASTVSFSSFTSFTPFPVVQPVFGQIPRRGFPSAFPSFPQTTWGQRPSPRRNFNGRVNYYERRDRDPRGPSVGFRRRGMSRPGVVALPLPVYGAAYPAYNYSPGYNYSYEQTALVTRLHELEAQRAGLMARWRLMEDEARRAGASPGWLRP